MYCKIRKIIFAALLAILFSIPAEAANKTLSVSSTSGVQGERVTLNILINDAASTAGAALTVLYNKTNLTMVTVESAFFGTFTAQGITPAQITVDNITYNGPVLFNASSLTTGSMLAAARKDNGSGTNAILFTLTFIISPSATAGSHVISVTDSTIKNVAAGYNASGEKIPMLIGINGASFVAHTVPIKNPGTITIQPYTDTDGDGINDNWERSNVLPGTAPGIALTIFSANGDFDNDGYSDLQEYKNRGIIDPLGARFNPRFFNAAGGTGYSKNAAALPATLYLLNAE